LKTNNKKNVLIDASKIITEALVQSGSDVFIAYPITPSNKFYTYGKQRFPQFLAGPDEISVLQWMSGYSAAGKLPVTATAFPGLALMTETLNMAYMMELPMVLVITQRLGPSTGSATTGAQGDLKFLDGVISGGFPMPIFSPSDFNDAWTLSNEAVKAAVKFRTPVIILTSKEMVMTQKSFDVSTLEPLENVDRTPKKFESPYLPYKSGEDMVPTFYPLGNDDYEVRFNSSTHDDEGLIRKGNPESMANTLRLKEKLEKRIDEFTFFDLDAEEGATDLIISWGISADAARDAMTKIRESGKKVSLLVVKTILPISPKIYDIIEAYETVIFAEENLTGQYKEMLFGKRTSAKIKTATKFGGMLTPSEIETIYNQ
jgi:2-oxoglutarate ferredoxin oxidoreductase subunit alpha